jgi:hypothetical protein
MTFAVDKLFNKGSIELSLFINSANSQGGFIHQSES